MQILLRRVLNSQGFTLVELMVVIVIISVLVAIAIPVYDSVTENAQNKAHEANERTIFGAAQMYIASLGKDPNNVTVPTETIGKDSVVDPYLHNPQDLKHPKTGNPYTITITNGKVEIGCPENP